MHTMRSFSELPIEVYSKIKLSQDEELTQESVAMRRQTIPSHFLTAENGYKFERQKNYKFSLPNTFQRDQQKKSQFVDLSSGVNQILDSTDVQVFELIPVDYLDKMDDDQANLKDLCQSAALQRINVTTEFLVVESRPYVKKFNLTQDKAQWESWQMHVRMETKKGYFVG